MEVADLNAFALMALSLKFLALFWSVRLYNRLRDPRMGALALIVAISLAWSVVTYAPIQLRAWVMSPAYIKNIPSVTIGILTLMIVMCLARVIEEERQLDTGLRLSKFTLDRSPSPTFIITEGAEFAYVNDAACRHLGYSQAELLDSSVHEITVGTAPGFWKEHWRQLKERGALVFEHEHRTRSGRVIPVEISANYLEHRGVGYDCAVAVDVTERHQAEQALRSKEDALTRHNEVIAELVRAPAVSKGRLEDALEHITQAAADTLEVERVGVWIFDNDRSAIKCLKLYERSKSQYSGGQELKASEYPTYFASIEKNRVIAADRAQEDERTREFADGYLGPLGITSMLDVPVRRNGRIAGVVCHEHVGAMRRWSVEEQAFSASVADIVALAVESDERHKVEEALEASKEAAESADRAKSEFLANVSRQIRTPMNGIMGMTELLLSTNLSGKQKEFANTLRSSADTLLTAMNDIFKFSGEQDEATLLVDTVDFDLRAIVEEVVSLVAEPAHAKHLELSAAIGRGVPTKLIGDPMRLWQVLTTIVGNAVRFTDTGEVLARVSKESETQTHVIVRFEVADTGAGMDTDQQRRVFAEDRSSKTATGAGLELIICKRIVEALGGEIGFYSEPGRGSTFWFTMLFEKNTPSRTARPKVEQAIRETPVLIVDDNPTSQSILVDFLNAALVPNSVSCDAKQAMAILSNAAAEGNPYGLAIIDRYMPGTDGIELAKAIKADQQLHATRILLVTNAGDPLGQERMHKLGIGAETSKPLRMRLFFEALTKASGVDSYVDPMEADGEVPAYLAGPRVSSSARPNRSRRRVLVADDNLVNQKVALLQLYKLGCEAVSVGTGFEVLDALERDHYDLVLMDCQMYDMDGFETTTEIRRREFAAKNIPIIGTIAHDLEGDHEQCLVAGMNDTLSKPLKTDELRAMIDRWMPDKVDDERLPGDESAGPPELDVERLRGVCDGDTAGLKELIDSYLSHTHAQLETLYMAIRLGTTSEIVRITKSCIDASESCGITAIVPTLKTLHETTKAGQVDRAGQLGRTLHAEFERVKAYLGASDADALFGAAGPGNAARVSAGDLDDDPSAG